MPESSPFLTGFAALADAVRLASGCSLVWKDADPAFAMRLPAALGQHGAAWCTAVKADPARVARCRAHDNAPPEGARPACRTCPFGVVELHLPLRAGGRLLGWAELGSWRRGPAPLRLPGDGWRRLPLWDAARGAALARLVDLALAPLAPLRLEEDHGRIDDDLIAAVCVWLAERASADLRVRDAARQAGLSPSRFVHRFAVATGEGFRVWLLRRVMARACRLLVADDAAIGDISRAVGFANPQYFASAFRRELGTTPSAWRRQARVRAAAGV